MAAMLTNLGYGWPGGSLTPLRTCFACFDLAVRPRTSPTSSLASIGDACDGAENLLEVFDPQRQAEQLSDAIQPSAFAPPRLRQAPCTR